MVGFTGSTGSDAKTQSRRRSVMRTVAAATAAGLALTLAQVPASATATSSADVSTPPVTASDAVLAAASAAELELAEAAKKARATGRRVELESLRGESTTQYVNPDGSSALVATEDPTRLKENGSWVSIDTDLSEHDGILSPEATEASVEISSGGTATEAPLAEVSVGSESLALDWAADLPKAELDGASATFDAGSSQDVRVTATNSGFSVHVVVDKVPATAPVYRLPVTAKGVRLAPTDSGGFVANDGGGNPKFWIAPTVSWDHTQDNLEAGPEQTVPVDARLVEDAAGGQILELRPDFAWMSDPARVLPITVDPDVYINDASDRTTYVMSSTPSRGYPEATMMRVGYDSAAGYGKARSYLQFEDLGDLPGKITKAELSLYQYDANSCTSTNMNVYPVSESWFARDYKAKWSASSTGYKGPEAGVWWLPPDKVPNDSGVQVSNIYDAHRQPGYHTDAEYKAWKSFAHGIDGPGGCGNASEKIDVTGMVKGLFRAEVGAATRRGGLSGEQGEAFQDR